MRNNSTFTSETDPAANDEELGAFAVLDALLEGLVSRDKKLSDKCVVALASFGSDIIPALIESSSDSNSSDLLQQRVRMVIGLIEEAAKRNEKLPNGSITNAIFDAFRPDVPALNEKALLAVQAFPPQFTDRLVTLAVLNSRDVSHCLRLLDAAEKCNRCLQPNQHLDLLILAGHKHAQISSRAQQLVGVFRRRLNE